MEMIQQRLRTKTDGEGVPCLYVSARAAHYVVVRSGRVGGEAEGLGRGGGGRTPTLRAQPLVHNQGLRAGVACHLLQPRPPLIRGAPLGVSRSAG